MRLRSASAVIITKGMRSKAGSARMAASSSMPLMPGMFQSDRTRSIFCARSSFMASLPLAARCTGPIPKAANCAAVTLRMGSTSSTTSTDKLAFTVPPTLRLQCRRVPLLLST